MDDSKRKKIAESIRRRVGGEGGGEDRGREEESRGEDVLTGERSHNSVAALLSRHGIQHSDWLAHQVAAEGGVKADRSVPSPAHDHGGGGGGGGTEKRKRVRDNQSPQRPSGRKSREPEVCGCSLTMAGG